MKAVWNGKTIAESEDTILIEGNHYFPEKDIKMDYLKETETHSVCPWKGTASYYSIVDGDEVNKDAAWFYPEPKEMAKAIKGHVAFWRGVDVIEG